MISDGRVMKKRKKATMTSPTKGKIGEIETESRVIGKTLKTQKVNSSMS